MGLGFSHQEEQEPQEETESDNSCPVPSTTKVNVIKDIPYVDGTPVKQRGYEKQCLDIYRPNTTQNHNNTERDDAEPQIDNNTDSTFKFWIDRNTKMKSHTAVGNTNNDKKTIHKQLIPVVLHIHGGGWRRGDKSIKFFGAPSICTHYAESGYIAVAISYRVRNWKHHREDVGSAFEWVRSNIKEYGGDPNTIVLSGHSAGANIASLLTVGGEDWLSAESRRAVKGTILMSGVYTLAQPYATSPMNYFFHSSYIVGWIAAFRPGDAATVATNSPSWFLEQSLPDHTEDQPTRGFTVDDVKTIADANLGKATPTQDLASLPVLVINAGYDMWLSYDAEFFVSLLRKLGATNVQHDQLDSGSHASVCWNQSTYDSTSKFLNTHIPIEKTVDGDELDAGHAPKL